MTTPSNGTTHEAITDDALREYLPEFTGRGAEVHAARALATLREFIERVDEGMGHSEALAAIIKAHDPFLPRSAAYSATAKWRQAHRPAGRRMPSDGATALAGVRRVVLYLAREMTGNPGLRWGELVALADQAEQS